MLLTFLLVCDFQFVERTYRWPRIVNAYLHGEGSIRDVAVDYAVSPHFVMDMVQRFRRTGSVAPAPHAGGNRKLGRAGVLVQWHVSAGVSHSIDAQGLSLGGSFLAMATRGRLRRPPGDVCCPIG